VTVDARRSPGYPRLPALGQVAIGCRFPPWAGRLADLRVDCGDAPLAYLHRLLDASQDYDGVNNTVDALFGGDAATALASADQGLTRLPGEENLRFIRAGALDRSYVGVSATNGL
jgi:hypothetical protein